MSDIICQLDFGEVKSIAKDLVALDAEVRKRAGDLASQAHLHLLELAQQNLHTTRQTYVDALRSVEEVSPGVFVIVLDKSALWIEDGMETHEMIDDLLKNNAKTSKSGSRYKVIPFDIGRGGASQSPGQNALNQALRAELKKRGIKYKGIERNPDGSPKIGLLHSFNISRTPIRPAGTAGKPGWGKGAVGDVMAGPANPGELSGIPLLHGVRIYQHALQKPTGEPEFNKQGHQKATRNITTFRVVSSTQKGTGKWVHPGLTPRLFFEKTETWVENQWEQHVLPDILSRLTRD